MSRGARIEIGIPLHLKISGQSQNHESPDRSGSEFTGTLLLPVQFDENLHLTERLSLLDEKTLLYRYTVDDPTVFTRPWSGQLYMTRSDDQLYEYACHEGNYAMSAILKGARREEEAASAQGSKK